MQQSLHWCSNDFLVICAFAAQQPCIRAVFFRKFPIWTIDVTSVNHGIFQNHDSYRVVPWHLIWRWLVTSAFLAWFASHIGWQMVIDDPCDHTSGHSVVTWSLSSIILRSFKSMCCIVMGLIQFYVSDSDPISGPRDRKSEILQSCRLLFSFILSSSKFILYSDGANTVLRVNFDCISASRDRKSYTSYTENITILQKIV